jgi:hypothetical protein
MTSPQAQVIVVSTYSGWMAAFTVSPPHTSENESPIRVPHARARRQGAHSEVLLVYENVLP